VRVYCEAIMSMFSFVAWSLTVHSSLLHVNVTGLLNDNFRVYLSINRLLVFFMDVKNLDRQTSS